MTPRGDESRDSILSLDESAFKTIDVVWKTICSFFTPISLFLLQPTAKNESQRLKEQAERMKVFASQLRSMPEFGAVVKVIMILQVKLRLKDQ